LGFEGDPDPRSEIEIEGGDDGDGNGDGERYEYDRTGYECRDGDKEARADDRADENVENAE
jgi:hypothetical protein